MKKCCKSPFLNVTGALLRLAAALLILLVLTGCPGRTTGQAAGNTEGPAVAADAGTTGSQTGAENGSGQFVPLSSVTGTDLPDARDVLYADCDLQTDNGQRYVTADAELIGDLLDGLSEVTVGPPSGDPQAPEWELLLVCTDGTEIRVSFSEECLFTDDSQYLLDREGPLLDAAETVRSEAEQWSALASDTKALRDLEDPAALVLGGSYDRRDAVALYLYAFRSLPANYITKKEARKLGWENGSLERYAPGRSIGGDHFGNYEENLPEDDYRECDIGTLGRKSRGAKRIVFTGDFGKIYYTDDHYEHFELLYGSE